VIKLHDNLIVIIIVVLFQIVFLNLKGLSTLRQGTTPDLSLATADIADRCSWMPGEYLGSDHRTILISINLKTNIEHLNRIVPVNNKRLYMKRLLQMIMLRKVFRKAWVQARELNRTHPLCTSCITYGSLMGLAELSQQTLEKKIIPKWKKLKVEKLDFLSVARLNFYKVLVHF